MQKHRVKTSWARFVTDSTTSTTSVPSRHRIWRCSPFTTVLAVLGAALYLYACGGKGGHVGDDASVDAYVPVDNDGDQFPSNVDCDDNDAQIYPGVSRDCQSDCDFGVEVCQENGQWSACTADTDCDCTEPGQIRQVDCGNCGWAYQECGTDFQWQLPGECQDEGECAPGQAEQEGCGMCGTRSRLCNPDCSWRPWGPCQNERECRAGDSEWTAEGCTELGAVRQLQCDNQCQWVEMVQCTTNCVLQPRQGTADFRDEVCVPGGPFVMGSDPGEGGAEEEPEHTVHLTPYFIDVFEVTNSRYGICVNAGVCNAPGLADTYYSAGHDDYPVTGVTWDDAMTFCQWDGGRSLPTEAQWEKAARGPAPREVPYTWGDQPQPTCAYVNGSDCECWPGCSAPVDGYAAGASYYNVFNMLGNVSEWVRDFFDADYYSSSPTVDPTGPASGAQHVVRGNRYTTQFPDATHNTFRIPIRYGSNTDVDIPERGFRCARSAY